MRHAGLRTDGDGGGLQPCRGGRAERCLRQSSRQRGLRRGDTAFLRDPPLPQGALYPRRCAYRSPGAGDRPSREAHTAPVRRRRGHGRCPRRQPTGKLCPDRVPGFWKDRRAGGGTPESETGRLSARCALTPVRAVAVRRNAPPPGRPCTRPRPPPRSGGRIFRADRQWRRYPGWRSRICRRCRHSRRHST